MRFSGRVSAAQLARLLGRWRTGDGPDYVALADHIRQFVEDGRLGLAVRVPAERELAEGLSISRGTVGAAYERLRETGFLASARGIGSWTVLPTTAADRYGPSTPLSPHTTGPMIDLALASPAALADLVGRAAARAAAKLPQHLAEHGYHLMGLHELRERIADRYAARGLPTGPDQIVVTGGGQFALMLALRAVVRGGDRVLVEHPTYPNALEAIRRQGAKPVPVPLTRDAWDPEAFRSACREATPTACYVMPDVHNPTGIVVDDEQRAAVVRTLTASGAVAIADESLHDIRFDTDVPPERPLAAFARDADSVITIGSLSKLYWGGLRVGWIRASRETARRIAGARVSIDVSTPVLSQLIAMEILDDSGNEVSEHLAEIRGRRDHVAGLVREEFPEWKFVTPTGGLSLWIELDRPRSQDLAIAAAKRGIALASGPQFGIGGAFQAFLRLPFVQPADLLSEAMPTLARAWEDVGAPAAPAFGRPGRSVPAMTG